MENQSFKQQLKLIVNEYLAIDNEIATLQKALKERKSKKENLSKMILGTMKNKDIQQMNGAYNIRIDFDEASKEWNANKRRVGQSYEYVCGATTRNGKNCQKKPLNNCTHCNTHS